MLEKQVIELPDGLRAAINKVYSIDELSIITELCNMATITPQQLTAVKTSAMKLVESVRTERKKSTGIDSFLTEYALSSDEGVALMCLAEALLRILDNATINNLIKDKLAGVNCKAHKGQSE